MIEISHLSKTYKTGFWRRSHTALHDLNLKVEDKCIYGFIGPNGAGKTTTLKLILGLLRPTSGSVKIFGEAGISPRLYQNIGFMSELPYFYEFLSGRELLQYFGTLYGMESGAILKRVGELSSSLNWEMPWLDRKIKTYSKGMTQKLGLMQAVLHKPRLVIIDEPMSGLDPMGRIEVRKLLQHLNAEGATIFYSTHVLSDVEKICDHVAILVRGRLAQAGPLDKVTAGTDLEQVFTQAVQGGGSV